ncbi:hypothetical protein [Afifella sp. IM 167]|uniref:hypothetical protein n=1 Tax=Afifella sp. IM 167 TaxID=2033586 RepID=UPI001CCDE187|nr:hypothetical protein [Afifella sp. IM 167]MBZ8133380.1 hypothetical protein [Afifella sp. IM 167]
MNRKIATLAVSAAILIGGVTMAAAQSQGGGGGRGGGGGGGGGGAAFSRLDIGPFTHVDPKRPERPRPTRRVRRILPKADSDCTCRVRRIRINGYLQPVRDCYELNRINGRVQMNYCAR